MKRLFTLLIATVLACTAISAQEAEIREAAKRYKNITSLVTDVTQTRHNVAIADDEVIKGHFYFKNPNQLSMVFADDKEMLLALGDTFTKVNDGKKNTLKAKGKGNNPFETIREVFYNLLTVQENNAPITDIADVKMEKRDASTAILTITPIAKGAKAKRRMMFTSCEATIDLKTAELRTLRINERGENYTQFDFSNYQLNATVADNVFDPQCVL